VTTAALGETVIGGRRFRWGERTFVMGIINVTPDSFSGDGLLAAIGEWRPGAGDPTQVEWAIAQARRMVADGADVLDVGGESTRPGHADVAEDEELRRVVPVVAALQRVLPSVPVSVDTTKLAVASAAVSAGASMINDVWGVAARTDLVELAAERRVPIVLMHNRAAPRYTDLMREVVADLEGAIDRALAAGVPRDDVIVDPGFGFGKTPLHNLELLRSLSSQRVLGRPILLGTSRKSTLGRVLDLPPDERLEATLATTALGIAGGADMVRVHDVLPNVRAARMADAIVRGPSDALRAELQS
jgi:dihydropteroate synthase